MKAKNLTLFWRTSLCAAMLSLTGCGQSGALYLPPESKPTQPLDTTSTQTTEPQKDS